MSLKGECLDNAGAESFFGSSKNERVHHEDDKRKRDPRQSMFENIDVLYLRKRRHTFLDDMTPVGFELNSLSI